MIDNNLTLSRSKAAGISVAAVDIVPVPAFRDSCFIHTGIGEQCRFAEDFDMLKLIGHCVYQHFCISFLMWLLQQLPHFSPQVY